MLTLNNDKEYEEFLANCLSAPKAEIIHEDPQEYQMRLNWYVQAGFAHALNRDYDSAIELMKEALELDPGHSALVSNIAAFLLSLGHADQAKEVAQHALELAADDSEFSELQRVVATLVLASCEAKLGDLEQAAKTAAGAATEDDEADDKVWRCVYLAYAGDEQALDEAMDEAFMNDVEPDGWPKSYARATFERDVAFDPYRECEWFINKIGETL